MLKSKMRTFVRINCNIKRQILHFFTKKISDIDYNNYNINKKYFNIIGIYLLYFNCKRKNKRDG